MSDLVQLARTVRWDGAEDIDICDVLFGHTKTKKACRLFLDWLKENGNSARRHEVSQFGRDLSAGRIGHGFRYNRGNFYDTLLRRLVNLGLIGIRGYYDKGVCEKYTAIIQPIPKTSPSRKNLWNIAWHICRKWNEEWGYE